MRPAAAVFVALFIALFAAPAYPAIFQVGVAPAVVQAGDLEPGDEKLVTFSLFTASDEPLIVYLDTESGSMDFFNRGFGEFRGEFSEEATASWIYPLQNPVEIDTSSRVAGRGWHDVTVLLRVPLTAEPGYHAVHIRPRPTTFGTGGGSGANIVAVTSVTVFFRVAGDARREGIILDTTAVGYNPRGFMLRTTYKNTGTQTVYGRSTTTLSTNGSSLGDFLSAFEFIRPGQVIALEAPGNGQYPSGVYAARTTFTHGTGSIEQNSTILFALAPVTAQAISAPTEEPPWLLLFVILLAIIIVAILVRRRRARL